MSDVAATAAVSLPQTASVAAVSTGGGSAGGQAVAQAAVAESATSTQSVSGSNYSLNVSESNLTYLSASSSQGISEADQRMMLLILALIQILFGSGDDDSQKRNAALGLVSALLQSGQSRQSQDFTYLEYNEFQYSESYSEYQATASQTVTYAQDLSATATPASGTNLNVTG